MTSLFWKNLNQKVQDQRSKKQRSLGVMELCEIHENSLVYHRHDDTTQYGFIQSKNSDGRCDVCDNPGMKMRFFLSTGEL